MTRSLVAVSAESPIDVLAALQAALSGTGPAVLPLAAGAEALSDAAAPLSDAGDLGVVPRAVAVVIETSGSTAAPKRVMLTTDALLASAAATSVALGGDGQWLLAVPAHYVAGVQVLVRSIAAGTTPIILPTGHFDPEVFTDFAEQLTAPLRFTSLVPVQFARLLDAARTNHRILTVLRRFTGILVGGQAIRPELIELADYFDLRLVRTYGSSETAGGCVYNGHPIGNTTVRVRCGELEISGAVLALGYLDDDVRTHERFVDEHGVRWYRTGDLGEVDAEAGLVRVLGRADNVIISGGEKVSLDAVERLVRTLPGLGDAVVLSADDAEWGQVPVVVTSVSAMSVSGDAVTSAVEDAAPSADAAPVDGPARAENATAARPGESAVPLERIRELVGEQLGKAARPAQLFTVPQIPLLSSGKPDRKALAERIRRA
ncbi:o-succinylbenzoate--CoA ligase [Leifsonia kafniensis]|uniref:O-succinylbenzoate--CoA ligase n=1 Tax=Leifsonia kafniensis TaxID=475957 RepID=A0ABP7KP83_9MICO